MRGHIRQRAARSWTIVLYLGKDPITGKSRQLWRTARGSRRDAERELTRLLREHDTGLLADPGRTSVAAYFAKYLEHAELRLRPRTWQRYTQLVTGYIVPTIGAVPMEKVRPVHVQAVLDKMSRKGLAPRTVVQAYRVTSAAFSQAVRWGFLTSNPAAAVRPPRVERPTLVIPDRADVGRLIAASIGTDLELPVTLAAATGIRRGDLLALRWSDVDLRGGLIRIQRGYEGKGVFREPKTARGRRTIAAPTFAVTALRRHRKDQAARRLLLGEAWSDQDLVIDRGDGGPVHPDVLSHRFARLAAAQGLGAVRLHDLRHGYATMLLAAGVHPKIASEALGHSSSAFTMDVYSHLLEGLGRAAAEAVQSALGRKSVSRTVSKRGSG